MRRFVNNVISICYTAIRIMLIKVTHFKTFHASIIERFSPNVVFEVNKGSNVILGKKIRIHSGTKIKVRPNANLYIGDNVKINYYCIIACQERISIGKGTEFGPAVFLYDHDHDYRAGLSSNSNEEAFKKGNITIGTNCWIGANTTILRGTTLGDNVVVGAGCVLSGDYPSNSVVIQKRETCVTKY